MKCVNCIHLDKHYKQYGVLAGCRYWCRLSKKRVKRTLDTDVCKYEERKEQ